MIASAVLANEDATRPAIPERLGRIRLRPHQLDAAARLAQMLAENGGALLADEVGLGKTYVALALAHAAERPVVVAPAALLPMWRSALDRVRRSAELVSFERLSRMTSPDGLSNAGDPDLVIVDEAHHARTPSTRRYGVLAALCARSPVLLLSATPLHNSRRDLAAQLALFLGSAAWTMSDVELAAYVVRRTRGDLRAEQSPPAVDEPVWLGLSPEDDCLESLLALPPPVPSADGGDGGALLTYSLVRQWASSRAALRAALRRRLAKAVALTAALESGRYPTGGELAAWSYADGAVQLAFAQLIAADHPPGGDAGDAGGPRTLATLLDAVRLHEGAVRKLVHALEGSPDPDLGRAAALRSIRARHAGERIIAFAESAETVEAMYRRLRPDGGVAMLRASGAAVSGGAMSRSEVLARFAPAAHGAREPRAAERIDMLLATDLLSEGVNLQDASVVVHLDLPWNPARLEQRVGRASRIGSRHARVAVYAIRPPAAAERLLEVEQRLRAKLAAAGRAVGVAGAILPGFGAATNERGAAGEWTRVVAMLRGWRAASDAPVQHDRTTTAVAAVRSERTGFVAALGRDRTPRLLAAVGGAEASSAPAAIVAAMALASGTDVQIDGERLAAAVDAIDRWSARHAVTSLAGVSTGPIARARRRVLARIAHVTSRAPRHLRSVVGPLAAEARCAALAPLGEGAERVLAELAEAPLADQAWLRAISAFGEIHRRGGARAPSRDVDAPPLAALLLLDDAGP